jgi:hypothetical protein
MSLNLTSGRTEPCSDSVGGIRKIYLFNYVDYTNSQIIVSNQTLTTFPATTIYDFWVSNASMTETITNDDNGVSYDQSLNFRLKKQDIPTTLDLDTIRRGELRYIIELNDGRFKIGGLYKGATISSMTFNSGGAKAEGSNYDINITGQEEVNSYFIDNLSSAGFTVAEWLLVEAGEDLFSESFESIILE